MTSPVIYISGPISNPETRLVYRNLRRFFAAESALLLRGVAPINPASDVFSLMLWDDGVFEDEELFWSVFTAKDEALVRAAHGLYLLPEWTTSAGARLEVGWSVQSGVPYSTDMEDIIDLATNYMLSLEEVAL